MILVTGDWQMRAGNLATFDELVPALHRICLEHNVQTVVHCGDMKDPLNPLDVRVGNAACEIVQGFRLKEIPFYVLLGNHDMTGYNNTSASWFPMLRAAGAIAIDLPSSQRICGLSCHFLPFNRDEDVLLKNLDGLAVSGKHNVLFAHANIEGSYETAKHAVSGGIPRDALSRFDLTISGHIHLPQVSKDKRVWYTGSPFAIDWAEVNQRKRVLLLNPKTLAVTVVWLDLAGLFDPDEPDFPATVPGGSTVRVRYSVPTGETDASIAAALRQKYERKYENCKVLLEPKESAAESVVLPGDVSDDAAITAYVEQAVPDNLKADAEAIAHYINVKLAESQGTVRESRKVSLLSFEARNVLSFESVSYKFRKGLTVVCGVNEDWPERSNGAGKSNFLQIPLVVWFGQTSKKQKHDGWKRDGCTGKAWGRLRLLVDDVEYEIWRGRPGGLKLFRIKDGVEKDISEGGETQTQKQIEELTGLTYDVVSAALWIDARKASTLLTGQDAERKALLAQYLNLERFARAQKLVKAARDTRSAALDDARQQANACEDTIATLERTLVAAGADADELERLEVAANKAGRKLVDAEERARLAINAAAGRRKELEQILTQAETRLGNARQKLGAAQAVQQRADAELRAAQRRDYTTCPTCGAPVNNAQVRALIASATETVREAKEEARGIEERIASYRKTVSEARAETQQLDQKEQTLTQEVAALRRAADAAAGAYDAHKRVTGALDSTRIEKRREAERLRALQALVADHYHGLELEKFTMQALGKNGIPAFLMARLCPRLNRLAAHYSRAVTDGTIAVSFSIDEEQDVRAEVHNRFGGPMVIDQSVGESTSAVLIVALALRDAMFPCNVLIADEPGDGLDEVGSRVMAGVFKALTKVYPSVLLTSHNAHVLSELSGARVQTIRKSNKVSVLQ